VHISYQGRGL